MPDPQFDPAAELARLQMQGPGTAPVFDPAAELARLQMAPGTARFADPGLGRDIAQAGSYGLRGILGGVGSMLGDMPNLLFRGLDATVGRYVIDPLARHVMGGDGSVTERARATREANPMLPTSENLIAAGRNSGLVDRPDLAPRTTGERFRAAAAEGAGSGLTMAPVMGGGPLAATARALISGAGGGVGGEFGRQVYANTPYEGAAQLAGNIIGGLGGNLAASAAERGVNAVRNVGPGLDPYRIAGVTPRMVGDVTQSPTGQVMQNVSERLVGGTGRMQQAARQTLSEFQESMDSAVSTLGNARTPMQAGEAIQNAANTWLGNWRQQSTAAWNRLFSILPETAPIDTTQTRAAVNALGQRMSDVPGVAQVMQGDQFRALREAINNTPQQWRSESLRTLRSIVGELIDNANIGGNIPQSELRQLYAAISADVRNAVAMRRGGLEAWDAANAVTRTGHAIIDRTVGRLTQPMADGRNAITPEAAFNWATGQATMRAGGGTRLGEVRDVMNSAAPDSFGNVGSAVLSRAAGDVANTRNPSSALNLLGTRGNTLSPEARDILFGNATAQPRQVIDALAQIADRARVTGRLGNPSGTAGTAANIDWLRDAGTAIGGGAGMLLGGVPEAALGGVLGRLVGAPVAGYAVARAATSPVLARLAGAQSGGPGAREALQQALIRAALSPSARAALLPSNGTRQ